MYQIPFFGIFFWKTVVMNPKNRPDGWLRPIIVSNNRWTLVG